LKKLLLAVLLLAGSVSATDVATYNYTRTWAGDSAAGAKRVDTVYSNPFYLAGKPGYCYWFSCAERQQPGSVRDSNFTGDSLFFRIQHASDPTLPNKYWTTLALQTIVLNNAITVDTVVNSTVKLRADSTWTGEWARAMFIYVDSSEAAAAGPVGRSYYKQFKLFLNRVF